MEHSKGKYGFTPQMEIWKNAGGLKCKTCKGQIKKFSQQVGWILGEQIIPIPGDFTGQYPTVAALGWQRYIDSYSANWGSERIWETWRIQGFNFFSEVNKCGL